MIKVSRISSRLQAWLPLLPLIFLVFGSYWLTLQVQPLPPAHKEMRHDIDFVVEDLSTTALNEKGQTKYILSAKKMWHFPDDNTTHLDLPFFTSPHADQPPLHITALTGTLSDKGEQVYLYDNVEVTRDAFKTTSERKFLTDYLHITPNRDWAETDHPIVMFDSSNVVTAVGMQLDSRARTVNLLSKVKATHAAKP